MNIKTIDCIRRENLEFLIDYKFGSQSSFAGRLGKTSLSQATLSDIIREKRSLHVTEARLIEQKIIIPHGWMDRNGWVKEGYSFIEKYQKMTEEEQKFFNETVEFIDKQKNPNK